MADPADVIVLARAWIGTPYAHQASALGAGSDCLGLIRGVWRGLYGHEPEAAPAYTPDWGEFGTGELLLAGAMRHLRPVARAAMLAEAQVLLFRMRAGAVAKHMGIVTDAGAEPRFIHAYSGHGVFESPLTSPWQNRIAARFSFP